MLKNVLSLVVTCPLCHETHVVTNDVSVDFYGDEMDAGGWLNFYCHTKNKPTDLDLENDHNILGVGR